MGDESSLPLFSSSFGPNATVPNTKSWISSNLNVTSIDMTAFILMDSVLRDIDKDEMSVLVLFSLLRISETPMQNNLLICWCDFAQASTVR